jgi:hypothetical protein
VREALGLAAALSLCDGAPGTLIHLGEPFGVFGHSGIRGECIPHGAKLGEECLRAGVGPPYQIRNGLPETPLGVPGVLNMVGAPVGERPGDTRDAFRPCIE